MVYNNDDYIKIWKQINEAIKANSESIAKESRAVAEITNQYKDFFLTNRQQMLKITDAVSNVVSTYEIIYNETIMKIVTPMTCVLQEYNNVYNKKITDLIVNMHDTIEIALEKKIYDDVNFENIVINNDGAIEYQGNIFKKEEIEETTKELSENVVLSTEKRKLILQKIILFILSAYICGIIGQAGAETYDFIKNKFIQTYGKVQDYRDEDVFFYEKCKIVDVNELNVREESSINSKIIGKLYYLQLVKEIDRVPYWTKIEYINEENNVKIIGWVSTKCIKSYNKLKQEFEDIEEDELSE